MLFRVSERPDSINITSPKEDFPQEASTKLPGLDFPYPLFP